MTKDTPSGKIITSSTRVAYCEFDQRAEEGSAVYYVDDGRRVNGLVTYQVQAPNGKTSGHIAIQDLITHPPPTGTPLFLVPRTAPESGVHLVLASDLHGRSVHLRLNHLFRHTMVAGRSTTGKTHGGIAIAEDLLGLKVPHLILDPQDEFLGLKDIDPTVVILDHDPNPKKVIDLLRRRLTVIVPMMGQSVEAKANTIRTLVDGMFDAKERAYADDPGLLPPILITIDEAETFAPTKAAGVVDADCLDAIQNMAKRGIKLGLGLILLVQRPSMLNVDVRSQCNNAMLFALDDAGSLSIIKNLNITRYELDLVKRLRQGECVVLGSFVERPHVVRIRPLKAPRTKSHDFEHLLGFGQGTLAPQPA